MRERPILFSGPMVRAILDGRKSQTRRVVKPERGYEHNNICRPDMAASPEAVWWYGESERVGLIQYCPYGVPGDRLWVREMVKRESLFGEKVEYLADHSIHPDANWAWPERNSLPSIFMPRGLSRITLEVTEVRVERVQGISDHDALAEGVTEDRLMAAVRAARGGPPPAPLVGSAPASGAQAAYRELWDSINGKRPGCAWADNPWVWAISFRRLP